MTPTKPNNLFNDQGCIASEGLLMLIDKKLPDDEVEQLNAHARSCKLCREALEGATLFPSTHQYRSRVAGMRNSQFRQSFNKQGNPRRLYYGVSATAASLILFFGLFFLLRFENVIDKNAPGLTSNNDIFVKHDSLQAPKVELSMHPVMKEELNVTNNVKSERKVAKPIRPLEPNDDIVIADFEEEIIVEDIEFNGMEYDVELQTIHIETNHSKEHNIKSANNNKQSRTEIFSEQKASELTDLSDSDKKESKLKLNIKKRKSNDSYLMAEVTPMFRGGNIDSFNAYLAYNLKVVIPDSVLIESIIISFVIDTAGNVSKVRLVSGTSSDELNEHILDYVKQSPVWVPGYYAGKPIETELESEFVLDSTRQIRPQ